MTSVDKYFSGSRNLSGIDLKNLVFGKTGFDTRTNYLGSGAFGDVYFVRDISVMKTKTMLLKYCVKNFLIIL